MTFCRKGKAPNLFKLHPTKRLCLNTMNRKCSGTNLPQAETLIIISINNVLPVLLRNPKIFGSSFFSFYGLKTYPVVKYLDMIPNGFWSNIDSIIALNPMHIKVIKAEPFFFRYSMLIDIRNTGNLIYQPTHLKNCCAKTKSSVITV